jgi:heat shock protein HslJ
MERSAAGADLAGKETLPMKISTIAAASLLGFAALTPAEANAQRSAGYEARGTEPFWSASIGAAQMRFQLAGGQAVAVRKPRPIVGFNGERYVTPRLTIDVTHVECSDGMSDRTYKDTVRVTHGRRTYQGCGGAILSEQPRGMVEGNWRVASIGGQPVVRGTNPTLRFDGGRVSGNTGCNSLSGSYRMTGATLSAGPLATTKKACMGRGINAQESRLLGILGRKLTVRTMRNGNVALSDGRQSLLLERVR